MIGALLRRPAQLVRRTIHADLAAAGFDDIHPAHLAVFQHPPPRGARPIELARAADMSKQAMNHLLGQLERLGYIERRPVDGDPRATAIWLSRRGERAVTVMRATVERVELEWAELLGAKRFHELRAALVELNEHVSNAKTADEPPASDAD